MSKEALKMIITAEKLAAEEIAAAKEKAAAAIEDVRREGDILAENARLQAEQEIEALMRAAAEQEKDKARELKEQISNKCAAIGVRAEKRLDAAADFIVRRLLDN